MTLPKYFARICWNDRGWAEPAGKAAQAETRSYASEKRFGHEEWILNLSRTVDGWRYGYLTAIDRSRNRLLRDGEKSIDVLLWTKDPRGSRWYVAEIRQCEIISNDQAAHALRVYRDRRWLQEMSAQLAALGLSSPFIEKPPSPFWMFNFRHRPDDADVFDPMRRCDSRDDVFRSGRYSLIRANSQRATQSRTRAGASSLDTASSRRKAIGTTILHKEHNVLQEHLCRLLKEQYGDSNVTMEEDWVDIRCQVGTTTHFVEVKSDPRPRFAIREAIGQLLDYAYFPPCATATPLLHIVAPGLPTRDVSEFLSRISELAGLKIFYHHITREMNCFRLVSD